MQRQRSIGAFAHTLDEQLLLPLGPDAQVERELHFDDRVGPPFVGDCGLDIADRGAHPRDIADRQQRVLMIRTEPAFADPEGAEVSLQRPVVVAGRVIDVREIVEDEPELRALVA